MAAATATRKGGTSEEVREAPGESLARRKGRGEGKGREGGEAAIN